ncbi:MBG domain-containing protein [Eubacterium sp. MSJ-33]|uniref:MBG domain-containing protein n=1 Tax=Eubacterium sp. MSJ-33 TaxID=2841528 RepID=UPI001C76FEE2|nr:MBG domain-containing protein [Eubacterium sp. MSJ-33]QWT51873.1 fibronectin type III domain-containing protein [Eubacterium sp. MSJ-33]
MIRKSKLWKKMITGIMSAAVMLTSVQGFSGSTAVVHAAGAAQYQPMTIASGFNADVFYDAGETFSETDSAESSTKVNENKACFYTEASGVDESGGFPADGIIADELGDFNGLTWKLNSYQAANALRMAPGENGTITFSTIGCYQKLYFLVTAGGVGVGSNAAMNVTVAYTDGSSTNQTFVVRDWYDSANSVTSQYMRTYTGDATDGDTNGGPYLTRCAMDINTTKLIRDIRISNSVNNTGVYVCVYAVTGLGAAIASPDPIASGVSADGFTISWNAVEDAASYRVDVATDEDFTNMVGEYNNYTVTGTSIVLSGLESYTEYYYRVRAVNGDGGQSISSATKSVETTEHEHSWSISVDGENPAVANAVCTYDGVFCKYRTSPATLTLNAEDMVYTGKEYNKAGVSGNLKKVTGAVLSYTYYPKTSENASDDLKGTALEMTPSNVGDYWAVCNITVGEKSAQVVDAFAITKATPKVSVAGRNGLEYNGDPQKLVRANTNGGTIYYRVGTDGAWSTDIPTAVDASQENASYKVYYYVTGDANYEGLGSEENPAGFVEVSIEKARNYVTEEPVYEATYAEGTTYTAKVTTNVPGAKIEYSEKPDGPYRTEPYSYGDVGYYATYYRVSVDGNSNYATVTGHLTTYIRGKDFADGDVQVTDYEGVYDGKEHTITIETKGTAEGAMVEYWVSEPSSNPWEESGKYSTTPVTYKDVTKSESYYGGDYETVRYRVSKKGYNPVQAYARVKITPKPVMAVVTAEDKQYDGTTDAVLHATVDTGVEGETLNISGVTGSFENSDVGADKAVTMNAGSVNVTDSENAKASNYTVTVPSDTTVTASITPRVVKLDWEKEPFYFDGQPHTIKAKVTNAVEGDTVELNYEDNQKTEVGRYTAKVTGVLNANYTLEGAENTTHEWNIQTYDADVSVLPDIAGQDGWSNGTVKLQAEGYQISKDGSTWSDCIECSEEGEHTIGYYLKEIEHGYVTPLKTQVVKIDKTAPAGEIKLGESDGAYVFADKAEVTISAQDANSGITDNGVEYLVVPKGEIVTKDSEGWKSGTTVTMTGSQKSDIYARLTDKAGNVTVIGPKSVVIYTEATEKSEVEYKRQTTADLETGIQVNGNEIASITNGGIALSADDYAIKKGMLVLKNSYLQTLVVGTHTLKISYRPVEESDAQTTAKDSTITLTVTREKGQVTGLSVKSKEYDGKPITAPVFETTNDRGAHDANVTVEYKQKDAEDAVYTKSAPKDAGEYVVRVTVAEDENYAKAAATAEFTITPKSVTIKAEDAEKHVGMKDPEYTYTVETLVDGDSLSTVTISRTSGEKVGEYVLTPSLDAALNPNYIVKYENGTLTIEDHDWSDTWVVTQEATESTEGEQEKTCKVEGCGQKKYEKLPVLGAAIDPNEGKLEKAAQVTPGSPIRKATLDNKASELLNAEGIFTEEEKVELENGSKANVWLEISELDSESLSPEEKELLAKEAEKFAGSDADITFFNADLYKQVDNRARTQIHEPQTDIRVTFKIPDRLRNKNASVIREYKILRLHNGKVTIIDGVLDESSWEYSFVTNEFSTYAIIYKDSAKQITPETTTTENPTTEAPGVTTESPTSETLVVTTEAQANGTTNDKTGVNTNAAKTGDSFDPVIWLAVMGAALLAILGLLNKRYKDCREDGNLKK